MLLNNLKNVIIISFLLTNFLNAYCNNIEIFKKSYDYEKMQDYKDAIKVLVPLLNKNLSKDYKFLLYQRLGYLFFLNKNYNNSIEYYKKAMLINPESLSPYIGILKDYLYLGKYNKGIKIGNLILEKDLYNYYGNFYLGYCLYYNKNFKNSIQITKKILKLYPNDINFLELYLKNMIATNNMKEARKTALKLITLNPTNIIANNFLNK